MKQRRKKLLEQVRDAIRLKHYSYQTEKTYVQLLVAIKLSQLPQIIFLEL